MRGKLLTRNMRQRAKWRKLTGSAAFGRYMCQVYPKWYADNVNRPLHAGMHYSVRRMLRILRGEL